MIETPDNPLGEYGILLKRHARLIGGVALACVLLVLLVALVRPRRYTAGATIAPQRTQLASGSLASLAAQFGVQLPATDGSEGPGFYAMLLRSSSLLRQVVQETYHWPGKADSAPLTAIWKVRGKTEPIRQEAAVEQLRKVMRVRADAENGIVEFAVTTKSAELSQAIAARLLLALNQFNINQRRTRASAERHFTEERRGRAEEELRAAERLLERFLESNRRYNDSPALVAQLERLQREVSLRQQVYSSLAQAHERARLEEVRDTPVFTTVESPVAPARPDPRRIVSQASVALLGGLLLGLGAALVRQRFPAAGLRLGKAS